MKPTEKGRPVVVGSTGLLGISSSGGRWRPYRTKWILCLLTPVLLFFCEVRYYCVLFGIEAKYGLRALQLRLSHLLRVVFLQSRYVIRVIAEEILCLHGGKRDRNCSGHNDLCQQPTCAIFEADAPETVEQRDGKECRNKDHIKHDNGLSESGHGSLPNVSSQTRQGAALSLSVMLWMGPFISS